MDLLQAALIFLILLLSIFLAITGFQVFFILRDLKKALDKLNKVLQTGENIAADIERPIQAASDLVAALGGTAKAAGDAATKAITGVMHTSSNKRESKPKSKRFYKKVL